MLAVGGFSAVALGGLGAGAAFAAPSSHASPPPTTTSSVSQPGSQGTADGDTAQVGDQSTPDVAGQAEQPDGTAQEKPEQANDNPAGHADPPGDVQHNGGPNEP